MSNAEVFPAGLVRPDERGRFALRKYLTSEPVLEWRLFKSRDGKTVTIQAVTE